MLELKLFIEKDHSPNIHGLSQQEFHISMIKSELPCADNDYSVLAEMQTRTALMPRAACLRFH